MVQATKAELGVGPREVLGKKVKRLRRQGLTPGNIYGHNLASVAIQVPTEELRHVLRTAGRNQIVYLRLDGQEQRPTFIRAVQRDSLTDAILHVDFHQISLEETVRLDVPLHLEGTAPAVETYGGTLLLSLEHISVEALPAEIPSRIEIDVSGLTEIGDSLHVRDLPIPSNVTVLTDPELVVASVAAPAKAEVEEVPVEEEAVPGEEAAEGAEGAAPEGGAEKSEE